MIAIYNICSKVFVLPKQSYLCYIGYMEKKVFKLFPSNPINLYNYIVTSCFLNLDSLYESGSLVVAANIMFNQQ